MKENLLQSKIINKHRAEGWLTLRLRSTEPPGYPDLIVIKDGIVKFIEVKTRKGKLSKLQSYRIDLLRTNKMEVEIINDN